MDSRGFLEAFGTRTQGSVHWKGPQAQDLASEGHTLNCCNGLLVGWASRSNLQFAKVFVVELSTVEPPRPIVLWANTYWY